MSSAIRVLKFNPRRSNSLLGFADVTFGSLLIHDVGIHSKDERRWVSMPAKPMINRDGQVIRGDDGKTKYAPILSWADKETANRFSDAVIAALLAGWPGALS